MRRVILFLAAVTICIGYQSPLKAGEIDILVDKLVEKNILTPVEAQIILDETKTEVAKQIAEGKYSTLPSWLQNIKLKGDFRLRYQHEDRQEGTEDRHRGRIRYRLGIESKINKKLKVAAGLASGGNDPRSTNQTLGDSFDTDDIRLDYAFAEWAAAPWATVKGGKISSIKKVLYRPTDLMWDSDINPEGLAIQLSKPLNSSVDLFMNNGIYILDESGDEENDPYMLVAQPGFKASLGDIGFLGKTSLTTAVAFYHFANERGNTLDWSGGTNSTDANGGLEHNFDTISPSLQVAFKKPFDGLVPYAAIFAEGVHNPDPSEDNNGWAAGIKFGDKKIKDWGHWQAKYLFRRLEQDAWLDTFPDSDAYSGRTDVKGHEIVFTYGLGKNTSIALDWYEMERIKGSNRRRNVLQVDWMMKF